MEGSDMTRSIVEAEAQPSAGSMLCHHLESQENVEALLDTLFVLIRKLGLVLGDKVAVQEMANELLGEVVPTSCATSFNSSILLTHNCCAHPKSQAAMFFSCQENGALGARDERP